MPKLFMTFLSSLRIASIIYVRVMYISCLLIVDTAISINVVGSKLQAYGARPNVSVDRSRRLLNVPNTNEM